MKKIIKQVKENKQIVSVILLTALVFLLIGFYSGRFFEQQNFRKIMNERRGNFDRDGQKNMQNQNRFQQEFGSRQ